MATSRPSHIWMCQSEKDFKNSNFTRVSVSEAERIVAAHRNIPSFTWMEVDPEDIKHINEFENDIISTEDLVMCYLGDDIGYVIAARRPLKAGQVLVFAGELTNKIPDDGLNVYTAQFYKDKAPYYYDAKSRGGFASMLMDAPEESARKKFNRKATSNIKLLATQFDAFEYELDSGKIIIVLRLKKNIKSMELLAITYQCTSRLGYKSFIGFDKRGTRISEIDNQILNHILLKPIQYRDLQYQWQISLSKAIELIAADDALSAVKRLIKLEKEDQENVISQLTKRELRTLLNVSASYKSNLNISYQSRYLIIKYLKLIDLMKAIENEITKAVERKLESRELVKTVIKCNQRQISNRGNGNYLLLPCSDGMNTYVIYQDAHHDIYQIGKLHEAVNPDSNIPSKYYKFSLFYANRNNCNDDAFTDRVTSDLERVLKK